MPHQNLLRGLDRDASGIYVMPGEVEISYPDDGHEQCAAIEAGSLWFKHRNDCIVQLADHFGFRGTMLDVGGGNGYVALALGNPDRVCWLVEPGLSGCREAKARGIETVICATLESLELEDVGVDGAGLFDVLEHIENPEGILDAVYRVLRPSGRLLVSVPAMPWLWSGEDVVAGHFRRYTNGSLTRQLENAGFVVEQSGYFFFPLVLPVLLARTLPSLFIPPQPSTLDRVQKDHVDHEGGLGQRWVTKWLARERDRMANQKMPWVGTSCLAVATKLG